MRAEYHCGAPCRPHYQRSSPRRPGPGATVHSCRPSCPKGMDLTPIGHGTSPLSWYKSVDLMVSQFYPKSTTTSPSRETYPCMHDPNTPSATLVASVFHKNRLYDIHLPKFASPKYLYGTNDASAPSPAALLDLRARPARSRPPRAVRLLAPPGVGES